MMDPDADGIKIVYSAAVPDGEVWVVPSLYRRPAEILSDFNRRIAAGTYRLTDLDDR